MHIRTLTDSGGFRIYSVPQTLYKVHPDFDAILKAILLRDEGAFIAVPRGNMADRWMERLHSRLQKSLGDNELLHRVLYLPRMNASEYLTMNMVSSVVLDTFPVGGGRSSYEILSVGTPIVVLHPRTSILQLTSGMYRAMGILDEIGCVQYSEEDYIMTAVDIATNSSRRSLIRDQILEKNHILYTDIEGMYYQIKNKS